MRKPTDKLHGFFFSLIMLGLLAAVHFSVGGQTKKPPNKPASSVSQPPQTSDFSKLTIWEPTTPRPLSLSFQVNSNVVGNLHWKDGAWIFEGNAAESAKLFIAEINKQEGEPCGRRALLDVLELAERLFVPHATVGAIEWAERQSTLEMRPHNYPAPRTAAEHRAEADRLAKIEAQQAAEQQQRDEAAMRIREILRSCR